MGTAGKRSPDDAGSTSPTSAGENEEEALERIASMSDEDLDAHLVHRGVDVADLDAQVDSIRELADSIREQVVSSRGGARALGTAAYLDEEGSRAPRLGLVRKVLVACLVLAVAVAGGNALASLLR